jgi:predicted transcriptional regulator
MMTRSRLEIYLDLLIAVSQNTDLLTIADRVKLTVAAANVHLTFLITQGFVETRFTPSHRIIYELTTKGAEAVSAFMQLSGRTTPALERQLTT